MIELIQNPGAMPGLWTGSPQNMAIVGQIPEVFEPFLSVELGMVFALVNPRDRVLVVLPTRIAKGEG